MITIFVDASASLEPGASDRLGHLSEAGHELVLVAPSHHTSAGSAPWRARLDHVPDPPPSGSWFLTADPTACGDRQANLRTVLIGPRAAGRSPTRCDTTARDLREAVLAILAADAMR